MTKIQKPIILAICGKSAAGKDTLAQFLTDYLCNQKINAHNIISVTTRPKRIKEKDGRDYYFVTKQKFQKLIQERRLIEFSNFRGWYYGVPKWEIIPNAVNIGVFNPDGLENLTRYKYNYNVIPIYLEVPIGERMRRSRDREGQFKFEFLRRAFVDWKDFIKIDDTLKSLNNGLYIKMSETDGVWKQARAIESLLNHWGILNIDKQTGQLRLGNFV